MGRRLLSSVFTVAAAAFVLLRAGTGLAASGGGGGGSQTPPPTFSLPPSLACAGTVAEVNGQPWGYVVWNAGDSRWFATHDVAVWLKPANGDFALQGVMGLMTDAQAIRAWIPRAAALGDDLGAAHFLTGEMLRQWKAAEPHPEDLAERLSWLAGRAKQVAESAAALRQMGNSRPIFRFITGTAWAGPLGVAEGQEAVIELRERNPATGEEGAVVGRVVLAAGAVEALSAPGAPVQVPPRFLQELPAPAEAPLALPESSGVDRLPDLGVALRWAVPEALRRQILLTRGFMVWRLPAGAEAPASADELDAMSRAGKLPTEPGDVRALARVPGPASKLFRETGSKESGPDVADLALDLETFFMTDDNARFATDPDDRTRIVGTPYPEGEASEYYAAAVDLLGRYGPLSPAGSGVAVQTLPPDVPDVTRVENIMKPDVGSGQPAQRLRVTWKPNANAEGEVATTHYLVFRDRVANTPAATNALNRVSRPAEWQNLIYLGVVEHPAEPASEISFDDDTLASTPEDCGRPYLYCVRAAHLGPFGYNLSSPSPAVAGILRDREGPPPPSGSVAGDCPRAGVAFDEIPASDGPAAVAPELAVLRVVIRRGTEDGRWKEVEWVRLEADAAQGVVQSPPLHFGRNDRVWFDFVVPKGHDWRVGAEACTPMGRKSYVVSVYGGERSFLDGATRYILSGRALGAPVIGMATPGQALGEYWLPYFSSSGTETVEDFTPTAPIAGTLRGVYDGFWYNPEGMHASLLVQKRFLGDWYNNAAPLLGPATNRFHFSGHLAPISIDEWRVWRVVDPPRSPDPANCPHTAFPGGAAKIQPIHVTLNIPAGSREYRIYRRIDAGDLVLRAQGAGEWDDAAVAVALDDGMIPQAGGAIRYYGQVFDQHGNPSALALLGEKLSAAKLPIPVLSKPTSAGDVQSPRVRIQAVCPSPGVTRLVIDVDPPLVGELPEELMPQLAASKLVFNLDPAAGVDKPYLGSQSLATVAERFRDKNGALALDLELPVALGTDYTIAVRAFGESASNSACSSPQLFTWTPPPVEGTVPWPARPVPKVVPWNPDLHAFQTSPADFTLGDVTLDMHSASAHPIAIPIGAITLESAEPHPGDPYSNWTTVVGDYGCVLGVSGIPRFDESPVPADLFHAFLLYKVDHIEGGGFHKVDFTQSLLPFVLYRRQTARQIGSSTAPTPDTDITQVSPMIGRIAWMPETGANPRFAFLVDPFVGALARGGLNPSKPIVTLCLFDNTPVALGATYHYYLMHFDSGFEPDQIIDAGEVTIREEAEQ